jgi:hypothetical protein
MVLGGSGDLSAGWLENQLVDLGRCLASLGRNPNGGRGLRLLKGERCLTLNKFFAATITDKAGYQIYHQHVVQFPLNLNVTRPERPTASVLSLGHHHALLTL